MGDLEVVGAALPLRRLRDRRSLSLRVVRDDEILGVHRRQIAGEGLERRAEHARNHVHDKGENGDGERQARDSDVLDGFVMGEADLAEEVQPQ